MIYQFSFQNVKDIALHATISCDMFLFVCVAKINGGGWFHHNQIIMLLGL